MVVVDRDPELVCEARSVMLVAIPLGAWNRAGFVDAAVDAVDGNDEDFILVAVNSPNNLV